jgi:hypothetical protein
MDAFYAGLSLLKIFLPFIAAIIVIRVFKKIFS